MKALMKQALRKLARGLGNLKEDEQFGVALVVVIVVGVMIVAIIAEPLVGLAILGIVVAIAFTYLIIFPWLMTFSGDDPKSNRF